MQHSNSGDMDRKLVSLSLMFWIFNVWISLMFCFFDTLTQCLQCNMLQCNITSYHHVPTKGPCDFPLKEQQTVLILCLTALPLLVNEHLILQSLTFSPTHWNNFICKLKSVQTTGHDLFMLDMRISNVHGDRAKEKVRGSGTCWCHGKIRFYLGRGRHKSVK